MALFAPRLGCYLLQYRDDAMVDQQAKVECSWKAHRDLGAAHSGEPYGVPAEARAALIGLDK